MINIFFALQSKAKILKIILKHGIVSLVCGSVEYFLFLLLFIKMSQPLITSYIIPYCLATLLGYLGHNFFTFNYKNLDSNSLMYYLAQALIVFLAGFFIVKILLFLMVPQVAKLLQLISTFTLNIFFGNYITFNKCSRNIKFNERKY